LYVVLAAKINGTTLNTLHSELFHKAQAYRIQNTETRPTSGISIETITCKTTTFSEAQYRSFL